MAAFSRYIRIDHRFSFTLRYFEVQWLPPDGPMFLGPSPGADAPPGRARTGDRASSRSCRRGYAGTAASIRSSARAFGCCCRSPSSVRSAAPGSSSGSFLLVCSRSGQCFCPSRTPWRYGNHEGQGTPRPFRAELLLAGRRGTRHWRRWRFLLEGDPSGEPLPKALGAPVGAMTDMSRGERAGADRVAWSEVLTRQGARHVGSSLATAPQNARALGQRARRHYWLAPRSDDAVGAGVLRQGAGDVAAVASRLMPLRSRMLDWNRAGASSPKLDAISRPFGRRLSGDESGACAQVHGQGRCGVGHQPG
jgi:hypothetical protein